MCTKVTTFHFQTSRDPKRGHEILKLSVHPMCAQMGIECSEPTTSKAQTGDWDHTCQIFSVHSNRSDSAHTRHIPRTYPCPPILNPGPLVPGYVPPEQGMCPHTGTVCATTSLDNGGMCNRMVGCAATRWYVHRVCATWARYVHQHKHQKNGFIQPLFVDSPVLSLVLA